MPRYYVRFAEKTAEALCNEALEALSKPLPSVLQNVNRIVPFRTDVADPSLHTAEHIGKFYTVPLQFVSRVFRASAFNRDYYMHMKAFRECAIMVRKQSLEAIDFLKRADYKKPVIRYVYYGRKGTGKTFSIAHVMHYAAAQNWGIVSTHNVTGWNTALQTALLNEPIEAGAAVDLPLVAAEFLNNFRTQNETFLKRNNVRLSREVRWNPQEVDPAGTPIVDLIDFAVQRNKYAGDAMRIVLREMKEQAPKFDKPLLVTVAGVNGLFPHPVPPEQAAKYRKKKDMPVDTNRISFVSAFKDLLHNDWTNGAVLCSVFEEANAAFRRQAYTPRYLLGQSGFEALEPFVPIESNNYSLPECYAHIDYYADRRWLQNETYRTNPDLVRKELLFLSDRNPHELMQISRSW